MEGAAGGAGGACGVMLLCVGGLDDDADDDGGIGAASMALVKDLSEGFGFVMRGWRG
jgi:hypothetical protein|eukprot:evm.model.NODE_25722_length_19825_cov_36.388348.4